MSMQRLEGTNSYQKDNYTREKDKAALDASTLLQDHFVSKRKIVTGKIKVVVKVKTEKAFATYSICSGEQRGRTGFADVEHGKLSFGEANLPSHKMKYTHQ
jgi:hypothetical protein